MSLPVHERRADTGFTSAELGLYLFLAADAMFFGALYSSFALLRTAADHWNAGHKLIIGSAGSVALIALLLGALSTRLFKRPQAAAVVAQLIAALSLAAMLAALVYRGAPPAVSTFYALVHLFGATSALHAMGGAAVSAWLAFDDREIEGAADTRDHVRLNAIYAGACAVFWGISLGLAIFA